MHTPIFSAQEFQQLTAVLQRKKEEHGAEAIRRIEDLFQTYRTGRPPSFAHPLQKTRYFFPGLSNNPWHNVKDYPETAELSGVLERQHAAIQAELLEAVGQREALSNYRHYQFGSQNTDWKALYLFENGAFREDQYRWCPETMRCLKGFQDLIRDGQTIVSVLEPGGHIAPHTDKTNFMMSFHFAVSIPPGCEIRVGTEKRPWKDGETLLFDYSFEHEAWNPSDQNRIVLVADVWNPEITIVEREVLSALIGQIDR